MKNLATINQTAAVFLLRSLLGLIFFTAGYAKVFRWGIGKMYENTFKDYEAILPKFLVVFTAYYTSVVELIAGFLLIIGLFRNYSLYFLGSVLLIVAFGHGWKEGIWDLQHVVFRAILLVAILLLPQTWDKWQIDRYFKKGA